MAETMNSALLITAIGMGLVFLSIILLWWLMEAIVRIFAERKKKPAVSETPAIPDSPAMENASTNQKKRAAAAAVSLALAISQASQHPGEQKAAISPWQVAMRSRGSSIRGAAFSRKTQRNVK